jgi:hypothetical protein
MYNVVWNVWAWQRRFLGTGPPIEVHVGRHAWNVDA